MESKEIKTTLQAILPFWNAISTEEQNIILENTFFAKFKKGNLVHGGKTSCTGLLYVLDGHLRGYILSEDGKDISLYKISKYDMCMLSATCILGQPKNDFYLESNTDSTILIIDAICIKKLSEKHDSVKVFILEISKNRYERIIRTMQDILFIPLEQRLAEKLLDEMNMQKSSKLKITHDVIAKDVGSAREVISRSLKLLQDRNIVSLSRGFVSILDRSSLEAICRQ